MFYSRFRVLAASQFLFQSSDSVKFVPLVRFFSAALVQLSYSQFRFVCIIGYTGYKWSRIHWISFGCQYQQQCHNDQFQFQFCRLSHSANNYRTSLDIWDASFWDAVDSIGCRYQQQCHNNQVLPAYSLVPPMRFQCCFGRLSYILVIISMHRWISGMQVFLFEYSGYHLDVIFSINVTTTNKALPTQLYSG